MKIALVFSGIPRYLEKSKTYFQDNLLNHYDIDIFSYVWKTDEYELLKDVYNHKELKFLAPTEFYVNQAKTSVNVYSHWYGLQNACREFYNYTRNNNKKYDLIIRSRLDIALYNKINLLDLDKELLYVANCHWPNNIIFDDNLMIANQENYNKIFFNIFNWYRERLFQHQYHDIPEQKFYDYLTYIDIKYKVKRNPNLDFILTRGLQ